MNFSKTIFYLNGAKQIINSEHELDMPGLFTIAAGRPFSTDPIIPFNTKILNDKKEIWKAKKEYKESLKNKVKHNEERNSLFMLMAKANMPNWNFSVNPLKIK